MAGNSEPKQGQRSQSARGLFAPRSTMRVPQPDIIEHFWQRRCRAAAAGAMLKPQGGNCAVLPQDKMVHIGGSSDIALVQRFSGIHLKGYLKTKKMTDISQTQAGFKAKSLGILCGFQGFLTQNPAVFVEIDDIFDFSDPPWSKTHKYSLYSFQCFYFTVRYIGSISDPTEILFKPFFQPLAAKGFACKSY